MKPIPHGTNAILDFNDVAIRICHTLQMAPKLTLNTEFYTGMRALVADGSLHIRSVLRAMLGGLGIGEIVDANSMVTALEILELNKFDLLVVDEQLPPHGAIGLVRGIQSLHVPHTQLATIMMAARPTVQLVATARRSGIEEIITKPFSVADLDARIKRCILARDQTGAAPKTPLAPDRKKGRESQPAPCTAPEIVREVVYI